MSKVESSTSSNSGAKKEIYEVYFGYLVGRVKEVLEASISDEYQLKALKNVMADVIHDWWSKADNENFINKP